MNEQTASSAPLTSVGVVGNLNMDLILRGVRKLPTWGEGAEATGSLLATSGQAGYLAQALARLGVATEVVGNVGNDQFGTRILRDLRSQGVGVCGVEVSETLPTGICVAIARPGDGERAFVGDLGHLREFDLDVVDRHFSLLARCSVVCVVGIFDVEQFGARGAMETLRRLKQAGRVTLLDTGWTRWGIDTLALLHASLQYVDHLVVNAHEAADLTGGLGPLPACHALQRGRDCTVVVKCGSEGSVGVGGLGDKLERADHVYVPAFPVTAQDAVGAGDTFDAGYVSGLMDGLCLEARMRRASAVAAIYVSRASDRFPTLDETNSLLECGSEETPFG